MNLLTLRFTIFATVFFTVTANWVELATEPVNDTGSDLFRFLDFGFGGDISLRDICGYKLEFASDYIEFTVDEAGKYVLGAYEERLDQNINITISNSTLGALPPGSSALFCKACYVRNESLAYGDTCWSINPLSDRNRSCGCSSANWTGTGIYYGGHESNCECPCSGGAFAGYKGNGEQKGGLQSLGLVFSICFLNSTYLTPQHGGFGGETFLALDQGRINSIGWDLFYFPGFPYEKALYIYSWSADGQTIFDQEYGIASGVGTYNCTDFSLSGGEYIIGYYVEYDTIDEGTFVYGLGFSTNKENTFECGSLNSDSTPSTTGWIYPFAGTCFLSGWRFRAGTIIDGVALQFTCTTSSPTNMPSEAPTTNPTLSTQAPSTVSPTLSTQPPTMIPTILTMNPTVNPTFHPTCGDYRQYSSGDGANELSLSDLYSNAKLLPLNDSNDASLFLEADSSLSYVLTKNVNCTHSLFDHCELKCKSEISCLFLEFACDASSVCNVDCKERMACAYAKINIANATTETQFTLVCNGTSACQESEIVVDGIKSVDIHCITETACSAMQVQLKNMPSDELDSFARITCYQQSSCDDLYIVADEARTQLVMYYHNKNVVIDNRFGYLANQTVICHKLTKYFMLDYYTSVNISATENSIRSEYPKKLLPCEDVTIYCSNETRLSPTQNCEMAYSFKTIDLAGRNCYWVDVADAIDIKCTGSCLSSPTQSPTKSPTNLPSMTTVSPTAIPTGAPSLAPSNAPSYAPSESPTKVPSQPPSTAPSLSPTSTPSSKPTKNPSRAPTDEPDYTAFIDIVYIMSNVTTDAFNVLKNDITSVISEMRIAIEKAYFDLTSAISSYSQFELQILGIDDTKVTTAEKLDDDMLFSDSEIRFTSKIFVEVEYLATLLVDTSQSSEFCNQTTTSMQQIYESGSIVFCVENKYQLSVTTVQDNIDVFAIVIISLMVLICIITMLAVIYNRGVIPSCSPMLCRRVDNGKALAILLYGVQIVDALSDFNLTGKIVQDDEIFKATKSEQSMMALVLIIGSVTFVFLPYIVNLIVSATVPRLILADNRHAKDWFAKHSALFVTLVVLSGGCYPSMALCSSNVFGLQILNAGLSSAELAKLSSIKMYSTVVLENFPQLVCQILYVIMKEEVTTSVLLSAFASILSISMALLSYFISHDDVDDAILVQYYYRFHKVRPRANLDLNPEELKHLLKYIGLKNALAVGLQELDIHYIEFGYITLMHDGCALAVTQKVPSVTLQFDDQLKAIANQDHQFSSFFAINFCQKQFHSKSTEITKLVFDLWHIAQNDRSNYALEFHADFPTYIAPASERQPMVSNDEAKTSDKKESAVDVSRTRQAFIKCKQLMVAEEQCKELNAEIRIRAELEQLQFNKEEISNALFFAGFNETKEEKTHTHTDRLHSDKLDLHDGRHKTTEIEFVCRDDENKDK